MPRPTPGVSVISNVRIGDPDGPGIPDSHFHRTANFETSRTPAFPSSPEMSPRRPVKDISVSGLVVKSVRVC